MPIRNRATQILGIEHPILLAPMDLVSGDRLAAQSAMQAGCVYTVAATVMMAGSNANGALNA